MMARLHRGSTWPRKIPVGDVSLYVDWSAMGTRWC